jgi:Asp-tRNA(Asn)/Glu-tRNA(Gln) amidotransferase C subunit
MDFLFHEIGEKEKEEIRKQVNSIIESFSKKLSEIKEDVKEADIERKECVREEGGKPAEISREIMFNNAPDKNEDFIIAEKKSWK